jgi:DNA helicase-2/ATP-dependent DNA helicase PcrA
MAPPDWMDVKALAAATGPRAPGAEAADLPEERLLADLNPPQREAVLHEEGPMLILAGAGSGKTRVITRRIAWLVATGRASAHEILAITFTNKAAREMSERVEALIPGSPVWIGTFHATCARILRREIGHLAGYTRDFTIYDTYDKTSLLKRIVAELGYDPQRFRPSVLGGWISDEKSRPRADDDGPRGRGPTGRGIEEQVLRAVRERYERALREANALDFDDLLGKTLELFDAHPGVRDAYARRFRHVLVDEYQDTNHIQYQLTRHLASFHRNLAVCGDPDQSIYAWRGADLRNILDFERDFGAEAGEVRIVKLEQNYRSTDCILLAATSVIRRNRARLEKGLWTEKKARSLIRLLECADENDEAREIALQIHGLLERGRTPDEIAVFYRVNFMQRALERALRLAGIPYQIVGGVEFYERREIRDLVAYLRLLVNPRDDVALRRVINVPTRGIGEKSLEDLERLAAARGLTLLEALRAGEVTAELKGKARAGARAFEQLLAGLAPLASGSAHAALEHLVRELDWFAWLAATAEGDLTSREENVEELLAHAQAYDAEHPGAGLAGFLEDVALVSDVDAFEERARKVTLMTLHSSKGLEFPSVFVAGMEEGLVPHSLALVEGAEEADGDAGLEEERRLFYVGMTRAKDELCLTWARVRLHYGEASFRAPSRFLGEIPNALVEGPEDEPERFASPARESADGPAGAGFEVGDRVEHDHFGPGRVARLQGAGPNTRVTVDFVSAGSKVLLVQYAKLKRLPG